MLFSPKRSPPLSDSLPSDIIIEPLFRWSIKASVFWGIWGALKQPSRCGAAEVALRPWIPSWRWPGVARMTIVRCQRNASTQARVGLGVWGIGPIGTWKKKRGFMISIYPLCCPECFSCRQKSSWRVGISILHVQTWVQWCFAQCCGTLFDLWFPSIWLDCPGPEASQRVVHNRRLALFGKKKQRNWTGIFSMR